MAEIARRYGVKTPAVHAQLRKYRNGANVRWPWGILPHHKDGWLYEALFDYVTNHDKMEDLPQRRQARLLEFLCWFENSDSLCVVDYDPASTVGFYVRETRRGDNSKNCIKINI